MNQKIKLNGDISVDIQKLIQSKMVILANSGGGKSYAIRRIAEQAVKHVQVIILDPEGEFASLREKYDFILAGKNADVPVEVRSSAMLATKLLELNKSAVIDLYELHPQERQRYVKNFCDALVNAPKDLYHPVIIILDEAHEYVPEGKPSEATWAVELLASKGRKRGQCLILASQRVAKISKNVTAECNNKLIGRASQDIDMKRAGEELGFSKEQLKDLRQLKPGEFFAFGPAISDEVVKLKIGEVQTAHAKVGYKGGAKTPPPSNVIKKVLAELKDLPQEAEKELKTTAEMKAQITQLKRELSQKPKQQSEVPMGVSQWMDYGEKYGYAKFFKTKIMQEAGLQWEKLVMQWDNAYADLINFVCLIEQQAEKMYKKRGDRPPYKPKGWMTPSNLEPVTLKQKDFQPQSSTFYSKSFAADVFKNEFKHIPLNRPKISDFNDPAINKSFVGDSLLGKGEMIVLKAIAQHPEGISTEHIAVLTGYKQTSRRVYLQRLTQKGFVQTLNGVFFPTDPGIQALGNNYEQLPTGDALREHVLRMLPEGEKRVLQVLLGVYPNPVDYFKIEEITGYKTTSRRVYLQRLSARKLVIIQGDQTVKASDKLFD